MPDWKIIAISFLSCAGLVSAQTAEQAPLGTPSSVSVVKPAPHKDFVEIESQWSPGGSGKMTLRRGERSSKVKKIQLDVGYKGRGWLTSFKGESEDGDIEVYARKDWGASLHTFARWRNEDGPATLTTGVEGSLFGTDQWKLTRQLHPTADDPSSPDVTALSVKLDLTGHGFLKLDGAYSEKGSELGGEVRRKVGESMDLGASLKSRRPEDARSLFDWSRPKVEGSLRWTW